MIIDRIFSQVTKRTLSASISERIAIAKRIKHPSYAFERMDDGTYNVAPTKKVGFNLMGAILFRLELKPIKGKYALITKLRLPTMIYAVMLEVAMLVFSVLAVVEGIPVAVFLIIPGIMFFGVLIFSRFRFFTVNFDYDMRWAEFVDNK